jgi:SpoIIAA-like
LFSEVELTGLEPGALWRDLSYGFGKLGELQRFPRVAVVTGQHWVRLITQAEGALLPGVEMRAFAEAERESAWSWITEPLPEESPQETKQQTKQQGKAVSIVRTTRPDVVAFEVNGRLTAADVRELLLVFNDTMAAHDRLRILILMRDFEGVTIEALREYGLLDAKLRGWKKVDRYALVGAPAWLEGLARVSGPMLGIETRSFEPNMEEEAWQWIGAEPVQEQGSPE